MTTRLRRSPLSIGPADRAARGNWWRRSRPLPRVAGVEQLRDWQARRAAAWSRLMMVAITIGMVGILARVVVLKVAPDPRLAAAVGAPFSSKSEIARRGELLDRRGRVIASSSVRSRLFVDPQATADLSTVAVDIATLIGGDPVEIDRRIHERLDSRYVVVRPVLEPWQADAIRSARLRGVGLEPVLLRHYPFEQLAAALHGTVGFEHTGLSGMEHRFDRRLVPERGRLTYLRDARRRPLWIEPDDYRPGRDGHDVRLSMDLVIQDIVQQRLDAAVEEFEAAGGRLVVADCRTGEILAMYDALTPRADRDEQVEDPGRAEHPALGRNRCATDPYEPGSTFKPFVWAVATELGRAAPDETLPTPEHTGYRTTYGRRIRDSHYFPDSTWREVLVHSMNSGMAIVGERMSHAEMRDVLGRFGFGRRTACGLPGESPGIVTAPRDWSHYTQSSVAMGHEIAVTPAQMVQAFCALAGDGTMPALRLTAVEDDDRPMRFVRRAVSADTALVTRTIMRDVMREGTGMRARSERYELFGKSGTAQLPKREGGGYHEDRYVSSFIAGAPYGDPRIVVLCVIDDPLRSRGHWGSQVAGPAVRDVIDATLEYMGVRPDHPVADPASLAAAQ